MQKCMEEWKALRLGYTCSGTGQPIRVQYPKYSLVYSLSEQHDSVGFAVKGECLDSKMQPA